jgi:hypothetical protein
MMVRLTEAEFSGEIHAVLARVREEDIEVIVEQEIDSLRSARRHTLAAVAPTAVL